LKPFALKLGIKEELDLKRGLEDFLSKNYYLKADSSFDGSNEKVRGNLGIEKSYCLNFKEVFPI